MLRCTPKLFSFSLFALPNHSTPLAYLAASAASWPRRVLHRADVVVAANAREARGPHAARAGDAAEAARLPAEARAHRAAADDGALLHQRLVALGLAQLDDVGLALAARLVGVEPALEALPPVGGAAASAAGHGRFGRCEVPSVCCAR